MLKRFQEARLLLRKMMPVARRVYGELDSHFLNLTLSYAMAFYHDHGSTISDLHEAVETLEDLELTARRVLCSSHPLVERIGEGLRESRAMLRAREALLAKYLLYGASALAVAAFALVQLRGGSRLVPRARRSFRRWLVPVVRRWARAGT